MGFHPRMYASVEGFDLVDPLSNLGFDRMTVDLWRVSARAGAKGRYVSMHPRVVLLLDGVRLALSDRKDAVGPLCAACFIPAGVQIWSHVATPGDMTHLDIHLSRAQLLALSAQAGAITKPILLPELGPLAALGEILARECREPNRAPGHAERLAQLILLELLHHADPGADTAATGIRWLEAVQRHAAENLRDRLSVDDLAEVAGMSRTSFNRHFRAEMGKAPYAWVLELRCDQAERMMRQGLPFAEVAVVCGFSDQPHFNRVFKSVTGLSPSHWMIEQRTGLLGTNIQDKNT